MSNKKVLDSTSESAFRNFLDLDLSRCNVTVCLAALRTGDDMPTFEKLQLSDDLTENFRQVVQVMVEKQKKEDHTHDLILRTYEAGSKPDPHEVEYLSLEEHDVIKKQIASLASLADLSIFSATEPFVSDLRFYVLILQPKVGDPIYCFRSYTHRRELSRSRLFAALFTKGHFDRVKKPLFLFDQYLDCVSRGEYVFVFNKDKFQKIFRFFEMILAAAKTTLATIKAKVPIANFDAFALACEGHLQMLSKLKNIANREYLNSITMADIKKVMNEFPQLRIKIIKQGGKEMLVFDPSDKWELLRLLDDDYLKSLMTEQKYEVSGKRTYK